MLLTSTIGAEEGRYVAIIDIPNAFVQTIIQDEEYKVILQMRGNIYYLLMMIAPEIYLKYITFKNKGETVIYVKALNAIYEIMKASLLFHKKFVGDITTIGFKLNPYVQYVTNKQIKGSKMTVVCHIDDNKVSQNIKRIVTIMVKRLNKTYEIIFIMDQER